ncbi:DUF2752 domain-containing protein [Rosistilla oblonga]|uniref:DUF2752 domain-containing protein n=1 Tax=Rosistilla oblonga TaxID=2527990 RepID=A0A518IZ79_9BACT|nr:DUF2752 domain-containing protein [Rosistilla oblonga]QDV58391.1 hypothetical protein Mal33_44090 [Rosistilla oblonga]
MASPIQRSPVPADRRLRIGLAIAAVATIAASAVVLHRFEPNANSWYPKCPLHEMTGLHCPGCGTTRAAREILHGDLATAVQLNPLTVIGGPIFLMMLWRNRRRRQAGKPTKPLLGWAFLVLLILYFVARNVPSPTRSWFAPPSPQPTIAEPTTPR